MATADNGEFCARLTALLQAGASYEFLNLALPYLDENPADDHTRLMVVREMVRVGLLLPAAEILDAGGAAVRGEPELARLGSSLRTSGKVGAWNRELFEANLRVLSQRGVEANAIRQAWEASEKQFQLFEDSTEVRQVRWRRPDGGWAWLPFLGDHPRLTDEAPLPADHAEQMPGPYIFTGLDLGWYFARVYAKSSKTFLNYSSALYVVEPRPEWFAITLHLHDWSALLSDPRVMLFIGPAGAKEFSDLLTADRNLPLPRFIFVGTSASCDSQSEIEGRLKEIQAQRRDACERGMAEIQARYRHRDAAYWVQRFEDALHGLGPPLRILATVSTHTTFLQYSMRDAGRAVQALGHEFRLITEGRPFEFVCPSTFHEQIRRFDPDVFFVLDHLRSSYEGILPGGLPVLTWDQDALQHVFKADSVAKMSELDVVVGLPHVSSIVRDGCDARQFLAAHIASSPEEFDSSDLAEEELAPYRCDISYVSHGSQTAEEFHQSEVVQYADPNARRLLDALLPLAREWVWSGGAIGGSGLRGLLARAEQESGIRVVDPAMRDRLIGWHLWRLCDRLFRHQALEWAAEYAKRHGRTLRIYGNGWEKHPTLRANAAGAVQNGRELLCVYRGSAINLQLMPAGFIHQRALDGLLAGGFFMARATRADRRDPLLPVMARAIQSRGLRSGAEVLRCGDSALANDFHAVRASLGYSEQEVEDVFHFIRTDAQLDYAHEAIPHFGEITFADADGFARATDAFLADPAARASIAVKMRQTILDRYSYEAAVGRFLQFMADYLQEKAREPGACFSRGPSVKAAPAEVGV